MIRRNIEFSPPDISEAEIQEVANALRSGWITTGPRTKLLERRLAAYIETGRTDINCETEENVKKYSNRVVCLNSATAAEELNLRILGIGEGDEVIVPAYTYTATVSAAIHCGATVKFVDIQKNGNPETHMPEMDYDAVEKAITPKTKAIIPVDLGGIVCDYEKIIDIVNRKKDIFIPKESDNTPLGDLSSRVQKAIGRVAIVADSAHSLGANRVIKGECKYCGAIADFTSFSFHAVKNFTTGEGGAATWLPIEGIKNEEIYKFYQLLSLHGQDKDALCKTKCGGWEYDIIGPWYKCNMTDIMAAIGLRQLDRYQGLIKRREAIRYKYDRFFEQYGIDHLIHHTSMMMGSHHLYLIRIPGISTEQRNEIICRLAEYGVATNVHYKPLPMMSAYSKISGGEDKCPNACDYYQNLITLPYHTLLSDEDVDYICEVLKTVLKDYSLVNDKFENNEYKITGIHHIAIIAGSEESVEFYKKLGFSETYRQTREYDTVVLLAGYGLRIELFVGDGHPKYATDPENMGVRHLAFKVDNLDEIAERFNLEPVTKDWMGERYCFITDPDGLPIELHE